MAKMSWGVDWGSTFLLSWGVNERVFSAAAESTFFCSVKIFCCLFSIFFQSTKKDMCLNHSGWSWRTDCHFCSGARPSVTFCVFCNPTCQNGYFSLKWLETSDLGLNFNLLSLLAVIQTPSLSLLQRKIISNLAFKYYLGRLSFKGRLSGLRW